MPYYRLYFINPNTGRFLRFEELQAQDDVEAVRLASEKTGDHPLELWSGARRVKLYSTLITTEAAE